MGKAADPNRADSDADVPVPIPVVPVAYPVDPVASVAQVA